MSSLSPLGDALYSHALWHFSWLATPHRSWREAETLLLPWVVQLLCSWAAFLLYMRLDYQHYTQAQLYGPSVKLPSRHPLRPFWHSQLRMVPLVLFNQCVVWPLVSLLLVWPLWARTNTSALGDPLGGWRLAALVPAFLACMAASDQLWYWCHRLLHVRLACGCVRVWDRCHREHHMAEQCALSATFVHPLEYALFTVSMQIFFAAAGFPLYLHALPLGWGMFTGSGAHSGYSGAIANGDEHNAHHLFHGCNFGLLMLADRMWGTYWGPADPLPPVWDGAVDITEACPTVYGSFAASTFRTPSAMAAAAALATERKAQRRGSAPKRSD